MSISATHALPLTAPAAEGTSRGVTMVFLALAIAVVALVVAVKIWGAVALTMAALPLVPLMFVLFIWISLP